MINVVPNCWEIKLYKVLSPKIASVPLEMGIINLEEQVNNALKFFTYNEILVILAHPLGYVDLEIISSLKLLKDEEYKGGFGFVAILWYCRFFLFFPTRRIAGGNHHAE